LSLGKCPDCGGELSELKAVHLRGRVPKPAIGCRRCNYRQPATTGKTSGRSYDPANPKQGSHP